MSDFNQDKICEYIALANGTMVANPSVLNTTMTNSFAESQIALSSENVTEVKKPAVQNVTVETAGTDHEDY
jgi:hypothetical protein